MIGLGSGALAIHFGALLSTPGAAARGSGRTQQSCAVAAVWKSWGTIVTLVRLIGGH